MPIELKDFINKTHIDGYVPASFGIKIIHEDEIVGACTLRWKRNSKRKVLEIARMSFALNTHVNGGVSKIISGAKKIAKENHANSLFTYSDNRIGGYCYKSFMKFKGETAKRFWWTNFSERFDRFKFKADKARGLTEKDVAKKANVSKIYGCTNSIFEILKSSSRVTLILLIWGAPPNSASYSNSEVIRTGVLYRSLFFPARCVYPTNAGMAVSTAATEGGNLLISST